MTFLFWNLHRKPLADLVAAIAHEHEVDVIMLIESPEGGSLLIPLLEAMNTGGDRTYTEALGYDSTFMVLSRLPEGAIEARRDEGRVSVRRVRAPVGKGITLVMAHLPSKMYQKEIDQFASGSRLARLIEEEEGKAGHQRTVVVGDLNMNPFEPGVAGADALHAVMSRRLAEKRSRTVGGQEKHFFYNPLWGRFGDQTPGPPGTYHYAASGQVNYYWNIFDQVLIRPDLLEAFRDEELQVLTQAGAVNLLDKEHKPDKTIASDHLPLLFRLHIENL